jgi:glycosyltransferase involved in cell wall biosynthesis
MAELSVVIPLYNKAASITRTLESVFSQLRSPEEVIVVDDGSTDSSATLVREQFGTRIRLLCQKNQGESAARNAGLAAASHPHVCFLDADDEWLPGHLSAIAELVDAHPEALFFSTGSVFVDESGRELPPRNPLAPGFKGLVPDFPKTFTAGYGLLNSSSVCVHRETLLAIGGFPVGEVRGPDLATWLALSLKGPLAACSRPHVRIHLDAENRSTIHRAIVPYHHRWYLARREELRTHPLGASVRRFILHNALITVSGAALAGDHRSARLIAALFLRNGEPWGMVLALASCVPAGLLRLARDRRRWGAQAAP